MTTCLRRLTLAAVGGLAVLMLGTTSAHAQFPRRTTTVPPLYTYRTGPTYLPNGMTVQQYARNLSLLGQAYSQFPPWAFGYNPYTPTYLNLGPTYPTYSPNPLLLNPSSPILGTLGATNFYTNPYFTFYRPFP
jgi:hypothetical protein